MYLSSLSIQRLDLFEAFKEINVIQNIKNGGELSDKLLEYSVKKNIFIYDSKEKGFSIFIEDTKGIGIDKTFHIINPRKETVVLMRIDGVLFAKETKCDCAFITDNEINFIEFKVNAENKTEKAIIENYKKASSQLISTLLDFRERYYRIGKNLDKLSKLSCYAVFNRTVPKDTATQKKIAAKFLIDSHGVKLKFDNNKSI